MAKRLVNAEALSQLGTNSNAAFQRGLAKRADGDFKRVATRVPSTTGKEEYGWLGKFPRIREWIGERIVQQMQAHSYSIKNKPFESTIAVDRDDVEDDNTGIYAPTFEFMGEEVGDFPNELVFQCLKAGTSQLCYDGQYFFDTDHPVIAADGSVGSASNWQGGAGAMWVLMDDTRALKPIIHQVRREFDTVKLDKPDDPNVFMRKEFVYGTDGRMNVGYGFWQFAVASRQPLNAANYEAARVTLQGMKGDGGRPLNLKPKLLVHGSTLEGAAMDVLNTMQNSAGASNKWYQTAERMQTAWMDD